MCQLPAKGPLFSYPSLRVIFADLHNVPEPLQALQGPEPSLTFLHCLLSVFVPLLTVSPNLPNCFPYFPNCFPNLLALPLNLLFLLEPRILQLGLMWGCHTQEPQLFPIDSQEPNSLFYVCLHQPCGTLGNHHIINFPKIPIFAQFPKFPRCAQYPVNMGNPVESTYN